mgnify:CR=1 FL=1
MKYYRSSVKRYPINHAKLGPQNSYGWLHPHPLPRFNLVQTLYTHFEKLTIESKRIYKRMPRVTVGVARQRTLRPLLNNHKCRA